MCCLPSSFLYIFLPCASYSLLSLLLCGRCSETFGFFFFSTFQFFFFQTLQSGDNNEDLLGWKVSFALSFFFPREKRTCGLISPRLV